MVEEGDNRERARACLVRGYLRTGNARKSTFCTFSLGLLHQQAKCLHIACRRCQRQLAHFQIQPSKHRLLLLPADLEVLSYLQHVELSFSPRTPSTEKRFLTYLMIQATHKWQWYKSGYTRDTQPSIFRREGWALPNYM